MEAKRQLSDLSRDELYNLVWSSPATKIGEEFGISDVAVNKHCIRKQVPRPTRGHWAKIAVGIHPRRKPLPPSPAELFEKQALAKLPKRLALPATGAQLHPLAAELAKALAKAKPDYAKRIRVSVPELPEVTISNKALAERIVGAFHIILNGLEPLGIVFRKARSSFDPGFFRRGNDRFTLHIDETLADARGIERRVYYWEWDPGGVPTGHLGFFFKSNPYHDAVEKLWTETAKLPVENLLPQIIAGVRQYYLDLQKKHVLEAIERKRQIEESHRHWEAYKAAEAIRIQKEKEEMHTNAIKAVEAARNLDLRKAAEWWRIHRDLVGFIAECEGRWRASGSASSAKFMGRFFRLGEPS
jgi:hypothetical protein